MKYLKFTQYAYLIAGILVAIESFNQYKSGNTNQAIIMGLFTLAAIFLFFFRRNFANKFQERNNKQ
jgi:hypothetical protein